MVSPNQQVNRIMPTTPTMDGRPIINHQMQGVQQVMYNPRPAQLQGQQISISGGQVVVTQPHHGANNSHLNPQIQVQQVIGNDQIRPRMPFNPQASFVRVNPGQMGQMPRHPMGNPMAMVNQGGGIFCFYLFRKNLIKIQTKNVVSRCLRHTIYFNFLKAPKMNYLVFIT